MPKITKLRLHLLFIQRKLLALFPDTLYMAGWHMNITRLYKHSLLVIETIAAQVMHKGLG